MHRLFTIVLLLVFTLGTSLVAEEIICRYCQNSANVYLPRGMKLEGKYHYAPDRQVDVQHIKIDVTPNFEQRTVKGTTTLTVAPIQDEVKVLTLDAYNLRILEIRCKEAKVEDFVSTRQDLKIVFEQALSVATVYDIVIDYEAQPEMGLYFRTPSMGYPASDTHIWTQGEAHESQHWFPCFDYPNERSTSEVICHVPSDMTVLSNGRKESEIIDDNGLKSVHWLQDKPHVNYLICLVAGHFQQLEKQHGELKLGFYSQPSVAEHASNTFDETERMMKFFEEEIGFPFPWAKYDQVTIHDFVAGGMENTTLTTLTIDTIFSNQTENLQSSRGLVAHELAHQWFGDYVTCKDWSHLWLNEGFATYYAALYEGERFGRDTLLYELYLDAKDRIFPSGDDKRPIVYNQYSNPMEQFDFRSYPKGSWVLHMLRAQLGEDTYRQCIREYLRKHALSDVVSDDLRQVIEDVTGKSMDRFFDQWLYHAGHPKLKISYEWLPETKLAKLHIEQIQSQHETSMLFELPASVRFCFDDNFVDHACVVTKDREDFYFALAQQPKAVRFDPQYALLAEVEFDKPDGMLLEDLKSNTEVIGRIHACEQLSNRKTQEVVKALQSVMLSDPFFGVRIAAANALDRTKTPEAQLALQQSWDQQSDARVRSRIVALMLRQNLPEVRQFALKVLEKENNPSIRSLSLTHLAKFYGTEIRNVLVQHLDAESFNNDEARAAIEAIEASADETLVPVLIDAVRRHASQWKPGTVSIALESIARLSSELDDQEGSRNFLVEFTQSPRMATKKSAIRALGLTGDPRARMFIEPFLSESDEELRKVARSALNDLQNSKPLVPEELKSLQTSMEQLQENVNQLKIKLEETESVLKSLQKKSAAESSAAAP